LHIKSLKASSRIVCKDLAIVIEKGKKDFDILEEPETTKREEGQSKVLSYFKTGVFSAEEMDGFEIMKRKLMEKVRKR